MKSTKRFTAFITAMAMGAAVFAGCGQENPVQESGTAASDVSTSAAQMSESTQTSQAEQTTQTLQEQTGTAAETTVPLGDILSGEPQTDVTEAKADKMKGDYISPDTTFTLTAKEDISAEDMSRMIALSPDIPFKVEKTKERTYLLRLTEKIPDNKILKLTVKNGRSWAFQTADIFRVTGTFPSDGSSGAPINSGVEMTLSMDVDISSAEDNFTISPPVPGRFEVHNKTLVFVPNEDFALKTVYTVTVGKGLTGESGDTLGEDFTFSFKTEADSSDSYCYTSRGVSETFLPGDMVLTEIYASDSVRYKDFDVKLYKYASAADYEKALEDVTVQNKSVFFDDTDITIAPLPDMDMVWSDTVKLQHNPLDDSRWRPGYLLFPEGLESGYYLVNIRVGDFAIDRLIQISDLALYASVIPGSMAFFVNDAAKGVAAKGAKITVSDNGSSAGVTVDDSGVAVLDIPESKSRKGIVKAEFEGRTFYDLITLGGEWEHDIKEDYFVYLYTDRNAYLSTDTISVWGTVMPRDSSVTRLPEELSLAVKYDYNTKGESVPVTLSADGTFTAKVPIDSMGEGWYDMTLYSGESELATEYFRVEDYVKPAYTLDPKGPDVVFMAHENPFEVTLDAAYYDGTAAAGLSFGINGAAVPSAVTDDGGHISVIVQPELDTSPKHPTPRYESVSFNMAGVENEYQSTYLSYINIDRDVYISYEQEGSRLDLTANLIDPDKVTRENAYSPKEYLGAPVNVTASLKLKKSWTEKKEIGTTYYDFLLKQTKKKYDYEYKTENAGTFSVKLENGKAVVDGIQFDDKSSYGGTLSWLDTRGSKCEIYISLTNPNIGSYDRRSDYKYYTLQADRNRFKENETLHFDLMNNNVKAEENPKGRIFYAFSQTEYLRTDVAAGVGFDCVMTNDLVPNIHISGAYFDGRHIFPIHSVGYYDWEYDYYDYGYSSLTFDPADRELTLTVSSDRDSYSPGDDVEVTVLVKDKDGKAAANAPVNLSVVDEAAFAIMAQNPMPLSEIYQSLYFPYPDDYYTYNQYAFEETGGGEKGGGGDDYNIRKDFKDNAAFMTSTTDSSGKAVFKFRSPDNITTWRATAHSVDRRENGVYAGVTKEPVIVSLPFFITPVAADAFVEGDDVSFAAKTTAGNADITVNVKGDNFDETVTVPEISSARFGRLPLGDYTVTFTATDGKNKDGIELPFKVTDTLLETDIIREFDLSEDKLEINPLRFPVKLSFFDMEYSTYVSALSKLGCLYGDRLDYKIARAYSAEGFGYITGKDYEERFGYLKSIQLLSLWSYSDRDPKLTALIAAAEPGFISDSTAAAFRDILYSESSTSEEVSSAYLGLAALGEPVLIDMNKVMEDPLGFDYTDLLRFAAAYGLIGDTDRGRELFNDVAEDIMTGYTDGDGTRFLRTNSEYNDLAALMAASVLGLEHADLLAERVVRDVQTEESPAAYLMVYLNNFTPKEHEEGEPAAVTITSGGKSEEISVPALGRKTVTLSKAQYEAEDFSVELKKGKVRCIAYYEGRMTDRQEEPTLTVTKKIKSVTGGYAPGDMLRVTIDVSGMTGEHKYAAVDDVIPSGARFAMSGNECYVSRSGQRVSGYVSHGTYTDKIMVYYIRLATPGEFVVESAVARQYGKGWGYSERDTVTITETSGNA